MSSVLLHESEVTASTWNEGLETGKAVEVAALCSLVGALRSVGYGVSFPDIFRDKPDLFYLRNVIPRHHGAQAGHDIAAFDRIPLTDRFFSALTPKAIVSHPDGRKFMIFREGHPVHFINWIATGHAEYLDRPDILLVEGSLRLDWAEPSVLNFDFSSKALRCRGGLRVKNDIKLPLISYEITDPGDVRVDAVIECSVGKGRMTAEEQLARYIGLFGSPSRRPKSLLVNGRKKKSPAYDFEVSLDLSTSNAEMLAEQMSAGLGCLACELKSNSRDI